MNLSYLPVASEFPHRQELELAVALTQAAGALLLDMHQRGPEQISDKRSQSDIVTEADLASQALILEALTRHFPEHGIVAEERGGDRASANGAVWLVDPLDGTTNFAHRLPAFAVSIALWVDEQPMLGVVQDVTRQRTYWAAAGQGAWLGNERRLQVSSTAQLGHSVVGSGFGHDRATNPDNNLAEFAYLATRVRGIRRNGSAALDLAWVADGRLDAFWEGGLSPWDWAAGVLLIAEAGGRVSDYEGAPWRWGRQKLAASNGRVHAALLQSLATARQQAGL